MAGVRGDFEELQRLIGKLRGVRTGLMPTLRQGLAAEAHSLIVRGFDAREDPYGTPWKPSLRAQMEGSRTLSDTERLRNSFDVQPTATGIEVTTDTKYAATHQYGAVIRPVRAKALRFRGLVMRAKRARAEGAWITVQKVEIPRRQMVPDRATGGLGRPWTKAFNEAAEDIIDGHFED